jgi:hypothetical protein
LKKDQNPYLQIPVDHTLPAVYINGTICLSQDHPWSLEEFKDKIYDAFWPCSIDEYNGELFIYRDCDYDEVIVRKFLEKIAPYTKTGCITYYADDYVWRHSKEANEKFWVVQSAKLDFSGAKKIIVDGVLQDHMEDEPVETNSDISDSAVAEANQETSPNKATTVLTIRIENY